MADDEKNGDETYRQVMRAMKDSQSNLIVKLFLTPAFVGFAMSVLILGLWLISFLTTNENGQETMNFLLQLFQ